LICLIVVHRSEGEDYTVGEVVIFEGTMTSPLTLSRSSDAPISGVKYKNIQAHTSLQGWEPPKTPALWGRLSKGEAESHERGDYHSDQCHEDENGKKWHEHTEQTVEIDQHERKKVCTAAGLDPRRPKADPI
jgi:hypothetical protein